MMQIVTRHDYLDAIDDTLRKYFYSFDKFNYSLFSRLSSPRSSL